MASPVSPSPASADNRSPYAVARAVAATLMRGAPEFTSEQAVLEAVAQASGAGGSGYVGSIARAGHSIFYHQLQALYEWGRNRVPAAERDDFCRRCGEVFMESFFVESLYAVLGVAFARPAELQQTIVQAVQSHIYRYAGEKYVCTPEVTRDEIRFTFGYRDPDAIRTHLEPYGLTPERSFRNSFEYLSGAVEAFAARLLGRFDRARVRRTRDGLTGRLHLPIPHDAAVAYDRLLPILLGYIGTLQARQATERAEVQLESGLVTDSALMRETWDRLRRASRSDELVLLRGESGTGKSHLARRIHLLSRRRDKPFIEVALTSDIGTDNMVQSDLFGHEKGAFTGATEQKQGLFSLADGGTIFLDEVGDSTPELQAKLLRVLEMKRFKRLGGVKDLEVDVRVIAATNRDLERMVADGKFRQDLYYRLNVIPIRLPPLRERRADIPALAEYLLARLQRESGAPPKRLAPGLGAALPAYDWPGNIRELAHAFRHAVAMGDGPEITERDLPDAVRAGLQGATGPRPAPSPTAAPSPVPASGNGAVIDVDALRQAIRTARPAAGVAPHEIPSHIEHAKRTWLATLIEECGGDLALIAQFWDRSAEKTLRNLVREYGLAEALAAARARAKT